MTVTNRDRAKWAAEALRQFQDSTGADYQDALPDLLCDLMHWSDRENNNFQASLHRARKHYEAEKAEETEEVPAHLRELIHELRAILKHAVDTEVGNYKSFADEPDWIQEARVTISRSEGGAA